MPMYSISVEADVYVVAPDEQTALDLVHHLPAGPIDIIFVNDANEMNVDKDDDPIVAYIHGGPQASTYEVSE